jgi:subtilisin family serine protease
MKIFAIILFLISSTLSVLADTIITTGPRMVSVTLETNTSLITKATTTKDVVTSVKSSNGDTTNTTTRFTTITTTTPKYTKISNLVTYKRADGTTYSNVVIASITTEPFATTKTDKGVIVNVSIVKAPTNIAYTDTDANLGTKTVGYNSNPDFYKTNEFNASGLASINADKAYSRGWTGKGVTVAVADTGYSLLSKDLQGQVIATKDYTGAGINDTNGHGTFVLGEIVGLKNNTGIHGVAFDSKAIVVKVGTGSSINLTNAAAGLSWAADQGATIGNVSANSNYDTTFTKKLVSVGNGIYRSTDTRYDYSKNIFYNEQDPNLWKSVTDKGMVVVNSAGNQGLAVSANPGYFATAVDSSGNLILGGKMLIVGSVDDRGYMYSWSNKSGHICQQFNSTTNTCNDKYKVSDFYLVAPGTVTGLNLTDGSTIMSGTSMSAPLVTGGVSVISQMWPYMKGENLVQLVLKTANKNIPNYDVNKQGQGMLDLDKATQPYGAVGIPTSGKTTSTAKTTTISNTGGSGSAVSSIATTQVLSSVMVVDEFSRDYYINLQNGVVIKDKRKISDVSVQQDNTTYLPFNQAFGTFEQKAETNILPDTKIGFNSNLNSTTNNKDYSTYLQQGLKLSDSFNIRTTLGTLTEEQTWLANESTGALSVGKYNRTNFTQLGLDYIETDNKFSFDIGRGFTKVNTYNDSLIKNISTIQSQSYKLGYERSIDSINKVGFTYSLPSYITKGTTTLSIPYATTYSGDILYQDVKTSLKAQTPEKNIGMYYVMDKEQDTDWQFKVNAEYRTNIAGQDNKNGLGFGASIERKF